MSFRKFSTPEKRSQVNVKLSYSQSKQKSLKLFDRIFAKNAVEVRKNPSEVHSRHCEESNVVLATQTRFLREMELELSYTSSVVRQRIDDLNRHNLTLQVRECSRLIRHRLKESRSFAESLPLPTSTMTEVCVRLENLTEAYRIFDVSLTDGLDHEVSQARFATLEMAARRLVDLVRLALAGENVDKKRSSIDNGCLNSLTSQAASRFNEEDRKFIENLKKLEQDIDRAPPKPQPIDVNEQSLDEYLTRIEALMNAEREPIYHYSEIGSMDTRNSVKVENNCIMATSIINKDIPTVDGEAIESDTESTPTSKSNPQNIFEKNSFYVVNNTLKPVGYTVNCRKSMPERDKNMPLPPVPVASRPLTKIKTAEDSRSFNFDDRYHSKSSSSSKERLNIRTNSEASFSRFESPTLHNRKSSSNSSDNHCNSSIKSPTSVSQNLENELSNSGSREENSRQMLMAKHIPDIVSDPNQLLNLSDMQDDINIWSKSLNIPLEDIKGQDLKRFSNCSAATTHSHPSNPAEQNLDSTSLVLEGSNGDTVYNSEVKSDTEEYFEYFLIDGQKYRRQMKKRTVIEKIKIQKTVYAPLKPDGSGPDLTKFEADDKDMLDYEQCLPRSNELSNLSDLRRPTDDRFHVRRSMFVPQEESIKRLTMDYHNDVKNQEISQYPALLANYMYKVGQSDFEEPVIDNRLTDQLLNDVHSAWVQTSEFNLPHEKSKSICFFKKTHKKNEEGNTVQSALRITTSRTVRMKPHDNVKATPPEGDSLNNVPAITISGEEEFEDNEEPDNRNDIQSAILASGSEQETDVDSPSSQESTSGEMEETLSTTSTIDDSEYPSDLASDIPSRSLSLDSCSDLSTHSSSYLETKDNHSFILMENNPTKYLIFDDDAKAGECDIAGGPVDALIVYACDGEEHVLFLGAFLDTYQTFIDPADLINRLIVRYKYFKAMESPDFDGGRFDSGYTEFPDEPERTRPKTRYDDYPVKKWTRVLSLLLTVIGTLKKDLNERIRFHIQTFQKYLQEINETRWVEAIKNAIKTQQDAMELDRKTAIRLRDLSTHPQTKSPIKETTSPVKLGSPISANKMNILNLSSREIAHQITLLDWGKYREVELFEVLNLKDIARCNLPGVMEYAKHFQNVQYWTQSILLDPDKKSRTERDRFCWKFLRIIKHLRKMNNFSSLIAILLGIQLLPLKKLFSKRMRSNIAEMDEYMKPTKFIGYKEDIKHAIAPCIPFLGLFYQDIVMLNIANPPYLDLEQIVTSSHNSNWSANNYEHLSAMTQKCGPIINFWRSFKQYVFLKNCNKNQDKIRYSISPDEKILQFLNNFQDQFDENTLRRLIKQG